MEIWKDIQGYEGMYQVSNLGNIKTLKRKQVNKTYIMKTYSNTRYRFIRLCKNGKKKNLLIHRLVAETFIPKVEGKEYINHINGIKSDNRVENLEWVTPSENTRHAIKNNLKKLPNKRIIQIDDEGVITHWNSIKEASDKLGINRSNIGSCCNNKRNKAGNYRWQFEGVN